MIGRSSSCEGPGDAVGDVLLHGQVHPQLRHQLVDQAGGGDARRRVDQRPRATGRQTDRAGHGGRRCRRGRPPPTASVAATVVRPAMSDVASGRRVGRDRRCRRGAARCRARHRRPHPQAREHQGRGRAGLRCRSMRPPCGRHAGPDASSLTLGTSSPSVRQNHPPRSPRRPWPLVTLRGRLRAHGIEIASEMADRRPVGARSLESARTRARPIVAADGRLGCRRAGTRLICSR